MLFDTFTVDEEIAAVFNLQETKNYDCKLK